VPLGEEISLEQGCPKRVPAKIVTVPIMTSAKTARLHYNSELWSTLLDIDQHNLR